MLYNENVTNDFMCKNGEVVQRVVNCASNEWCIINPIAIKGSELQPNCVKGRLIEFCDSYILQYYVKVKE